jgi:hypothetical protein
MSEWPCRILLLCSLVFLILALALLVEQNISGSYDGESHTQCAVFVLLLLHLSQPNLTGFLQDGSGLSYQGPCYRADKWISIPFRTALPMGAASRQVEGCLVLHVQYPAPSNSNL